MSSLAGRSDVSISNPQHDQVVTYDSGASRWVNEDVNLSNNETQPGFIKFDDFAGATDNDKMTAMNNWTQAHGGQVRPAVLFSSRVHNLSVPIKLFSGLKLIGGLQAPSQSFTRGSVINWQGGSNSSVFIYPSEGQTNQGYPSDGSPRDITVSFMQFQGSNTTSFMERITVSGSNYVGHTLWYCQFHSCSWKGFYSVWWGYSTGSSISGQSYFEDIANTAVWIGGAETSIFSEDTMSVARQTFDSGAPLFRSSVSKSSFGQCQIMTRGATPGLLIDGGFNSTFNGLLFSPASGTSISGAGLVITGGTAHTITNCSFQRMATNPSAGFNGGTNNQGWIHVSGASQLTFRGNSFQREGSSPAADYPLLYAASSVSNGGIKWDYNNYTNLGSVARLDQAATGKITINSDPSVALFGQGGGGGSEDPLHAQRIGVIGDSLTHMNGNGVSWVTAELESQGWAAANIRVDGVSGRGISTPGAVPTVAPYTPEVIESWRADGFDPKVWLIALGTNNRNDSQAYWTSAIQEIVTLINAGPENDYKIYWIGTGYQNSPTDYNTVSFQAKLDEFESNNANFTAVDYNAHLAPFRTNGSWNSWWTTNPDGVHNTSSGYQALRVPLYGSAVAAEAPGSSGGGTGDSPVALTGAGNVTTGATNNGTALTISKPANVSSGDLLIAATWGRLNTADYTTPPSGWSVMPGSAPGTTVGVQRFYYKVISGTESPTSYTWGGGGSGRHTGIIFRVTGANLSTPFDANSGYDTAINVGGSFSRVTLPGYNAAVNTLLLAHVGSNTTDSARNFAPAIGMAQIGAVSTNTGGSDTSMIVAAQQLTSSGATGDRVFEVTPAVSSGAGYMITVNGA